MLVMVVCVKWDVGQGECIDHGEVAPQLTVGLEFGLGVQECV